MPTTVCGGKTWLSVRRAAGDDAKAAPSAMVGAEAVRLSGDSVCGTPGVWNGNPPPSRGPVQAAVACEGWREGVRAPNGRSAGAGTGAGTGAGVSGAGFAGADSMGKGSAMGSSSGCATRVADGPFGKRIGGLEFEDRRKGASGLREGVPERTRETPHLTQRTLPSA